MTRAIVHRTPGLLDIQAITVMGLSAKPNSTSPIGQFGTGLKYAIATLIRLGCTLRIFIGRDEYVFTKSEGKFRQVDVERIKMRRRRWGLTGWHSTLLPFTTNYGKFWEPWMAFRELEANTRDEGGFTQETEQDGLDFVKDGHTTIIVESPEYVQAWEDRDSIFLPTAELAPIAERPGCIVAYEGVSQHAYYRTLRALNLSKPSLLTWCLLAETGLTEDRFISEFWLRWYVGLLLVTSEDEALIERVITAPADNWEYDLTFPDHIPPSPAFRRVVARRPRGMNLRSYGYVSAHTPADYSRASPWDVHGRPWTVDEAGEAVRDIHGTIVMVRPDKMPVATWRQLMVMSCARINRTDDWLPEEMPTTMRRAYLDLIPVSPGTETWATAGIPDADRLWSALRMAGKTHGDPAPAYIQAEHAFLFEEADCPGHVASESDAKVCGRCGTHIDSLRPDPEDDMPF